MIKSAILICLLAVCCGPFIYTEARYTCPEKVKLKLEKYTLECTYLMRKEDAGACLATARKIHCENVLGFYYSTNSQHSIWRPCKEARTPEEKGVCYGPN